jgi:hypothetical protein
VPARALAPVALLCACLVAACGAEQTVLPDPNAAPTGAVQKLTFPKAGMSLEVRRPLQVHRRSAPEVFRFAMPSGAQVSAFAYSRSEPLPKTRAQLRDANSRLEAATRRRDPTFKVEASRVVRINGVPGVEITGTQTLSGGRLDTRSVHLFRGSAEYVFELIAARKDFAKADRAVFSPMLETVRLTGRVRT